MSSLFNQASLVLVPSGYKAGKVYSEVPTNGDGDLTFTRASDATRVNSDGEIEVVGSGVPRLDYSQGSCPALLLEPQRTNLNPTSQSFGTPWNLTNSGGVNISNVNTTNPFGFSSVAKVIPTTTLGQHRPFVIANYSAVGRIWVIAKADGYNYLSLGESGGLSGATIIFNLSNGTISGSASGYNGEISSLGDGWYKCSLNINSVGSSSRFIVIRNNNTTADYSGDGTSGVLIAHTQLEVGAYDTTPIFTTGTTVTRLADSFTRDNIYTNGLITSSGGTWFVEFKGNNPKNRDGFMAFFLTDVASNNGFYFNQPSGVSQRLTLNYYLGGIATTNVFLTTNDNVKLAIKWNGSTADIFQNGVKVVSNISFTFTQMQILNCSGAGILTFIQAMQLYPTPLEDVDCEVLTGEIYTSYSEMATALGYTII